MKKISVFILLVSISVLITSCMEHKFLSVSKRHYRNGYYLDLSSNRSVHDASTVGSGKKSTVSGTDQNTLVSEPELTEPTKEDPEIIVYQPQLKEERSSISAPSPMKLFERTNCVFSKRHNALCGMLKDHEDSGYILWTIISILIVLWLISLLTGGWGLGGLIYIFLVVALVLLLLRLLSVL